MTKKVLVIQGHPARDSFCSALAHAVERGATKSCHTVETLTLRDLAFDPILHEGYRHIQPLEAGLVTAQHQISSADVLVLIYPTWWGGMPALVKGFFDRTLLPGFAFKYRPGSPWWDKLLLGKVGHIITTMDTPPWYFRLIYRDAGLIQVKRAILQYCGIGPVNITRIGRMKDSTIEHREKWLTKVYEIGRRF